MPWRGAAWPGPVALASCVTLSCYFYSPSVSAICYLETLRNPRFAGSTGSEGRGVVGRCRGRGWAGQGGRRAHRKVNGG